MLRFGLDDLAIGGALVRTLLDEVLLLLHAVERDDQVTFFDRFAGFGQLDDSRVGHLRGGEQYRAHAANLTAVLDADDEIAPSHARHRHVDFRGPGVVEGRVDATGAGQAHGAPDNDPLARRQAPLAELLFGF